MKPADKFTPPDVCFDADVSQCKFYDSVTIRCTRYGMDLQPGVNYFVRIPCSACVAAKKQERRK